MVTGPTLGIVANRLLGRRTGVGRYLANLLRQWGRQHAPFAQVLVFTPRPVPLPAGLQNCVLPFAGSTFLWEHLLLPARLPAVDLLFCPAYTIPLGFRGRAALTIHDAIQAALPEEFPFWYRYRYGLLYRWSARRAQVVLADSAADRDRYPAVLRGCHGRAFGWCLWGSTRCFGRLTRSRSYDGLAWTTAPTSSSWAS
ncbi:MAG: hypothetical protein KatS3mg061_1789 [Dehalococcoidia bacterium]|nr:MAG: hypothetical protein KatS3mg061_1789 [Dehalococcoidia bacterium]